MNETNQAAPAPDKAQKLTPNEQIALRCLDHALKASGTMATVGIDFAEHKVTTVTDWRGWFDREGKPGDTADTKRKAFDRSKDGLIAKGRVAAESDFVFRAEVR